MVLRRRVVEATGRRVALVLEEVVRYALLDIVGFAREDGQRLVLDFQPKRVRLPSFGLRFSWPEIPRAAFASEFATMLLRIVASSMASIRPLPYNGVGILKIALFVATAVGKSG
jgi:hypothetical protein